MNYHTIYGYYNEWRIDSYKDAIDFRAIRSTSELLESMHPCLFIYLFAPVYITSAHKMILPDSKNESGNHLMCQRLQYVFWRCKDRNAQNNGKIYNWQNGYGIAKYATLITVVL